MYRHLNNERKEQINMYDIIFQAEHIYNTEVTQHVAIILEVAKLSAASSNQSRSDGRVRIEGKNISY
jgi:hypothetical protein